MIFITESKNDDDLFNMLSDVASRVPLVQDFAFFGEWASACGDRKKIGDLISCIRDGRHIRQVQQSREDGFELVFLIVEGVWRVNKDGLVQVPRQTARGRRWVNIPPDGMEYRRVSAYLDEITLLGGVHVRRASNLKETAAIILSLYQTLLQPPMKHNSWKRIYSPPPPHVHFLRKPSVLRRTAKELPGVGWGLSGDVDAQFGSIQEMANASVERWMEVDGIGRKIAETVVRSIRGGA